MFHNNMPQLLNSCRRTWCFTSKCVLVASS